MLRHILAIVLLMLATGVALRLILGGPRMEDISDYVDTANIRAPSRTAQLRNLKPFDGVFGGYGLILLEPSGHDLAQRGFDIRDLDICFSISAVQGEDKVLDIDIHVPSETQEIPIARVYGRYGDMDPIVVTVDIVDWPSSWPESLVLGLRQDPWVLKGHGLKVSVYEDFIRPGGICVDAIILAVLLVIVYRVRRSSSRGITDKA